MYIGVMCAAKMLVLLWVAVQSSSVIDALKFKRIDLNTSCSYCSSPPVYVRSQLQCAVACNQLDFRACYGYEVKQNQCSLCQITEMDAINNTTVKPAYMKYVSYSEEYGELIVQAVSYKIIDTNSQHIVSSSGNILY